MVSWAFVFCCVLFEMGLSNEQNAVLHISAGGSPLDVTIDSNSLLCRAYLDANHIALTSLYDLKGVTSNINRLGALVRWVHLLDASVTIGETVIELRSGQFSLAASATDQGGVHGEAPSDCIPVCSGEA